MVRDLDHRAGRDGHLAPAPPFHVTSPRTPSARSRGTATVPLRPGHGAIRSRLCAGASWPAPPLRSRVVAGGRSCRPPSSCPLVSGVRVGPTIGPTLLSSSFALLRGGL